MKTASKLFGFIAIAAVTGFMMAACGDAPGPGPGDTNQTPVAGDYDFGNREQTDDNIAAVTVEPKLGKSTGPRTIFYEGTGGTVYAKSTNLPTAAGTYAVTFNVATVAGWNAANGLSAGTLTIEVYNPSNQTPFAGDYDFGNMEQTDNNIAAVTVEPKPGKSTGPRTIYYEGTDGTVYAKSTNLPTAAGTYAVTFNVAAVAGWNAATGLFAGTLTITAGDVSGDPESDIGISFEWPSGDISLQKSTDGSDITFTVQGSGYTGFRWFLDDYEQYSETTDSITLNMNNMGAGNHSVTVFASRGGTILSGELKFKIVK